LEEKIWLRSDCAEWAGKRTRFKDSVADSRFPRDGRFIEEIGTYAPLKSPSEIKVDGERALAWIKTGAQPKETVKGSLKKAECFKSDKSLPKGMVCTMKDLLLYIVKNIVDDPESVSRTRSKRTMPQSWKSGWRPTIWEGNRPSGPRAKDIRTIMKSAAMQQKKKVSVEIIG
jgi:small subunit ribosomal protein S16